MPSRVHPRGFGCDPGIELDVVPVPPTGTPALAPGTTFSDWASHSADVHFVFGTHSGADTVQATGGHNLTHCPFTLEEARLSDSMGAYWAALAATGDPNGGAAGKREATGREYWPEYTAGEDRPSRVLRAGGGRGSPPGAVENRLHEGDCVFWEELWLAGEQPGGWGARTRPQLRTD